MLLFRSEEHLERWLAHGAPRGYRMDVARQWALAKAWFTGRDRADWRPRSAGEAQALFDSQGLAGDFWKL